MSYGIPEQIDRHEPAPGVRRELKKARIRKQRRRAKQRPDCPPEYRRFWGYSL